MKIRTRGKQAFNVPNNAEGHKFIELLRKFRNRGWYYRARGRGSREHYGSQSSIEQAHAEWLAVYMEHSKEWLHSPSIAPWERQEGPMIRIREEAHPHRIREVVHPLGNMTVNDHSGNAVPETRVAGIVGMTGRPRDAQLFVNEHSGNGLNVAPPGEPEDVAELTPEESGLLEDILESTFANWGGNISDEKQALFDTLMNKLID